MTSPVLSMTQKMGIYLKPYFSLAYVAVYRYKLYIIITNYYMKTCEN